jgi:hypothetical protein
MCKSIATSPGRRKRTALLTAFALSACLPLAAVAQQPDLNVLSLHWARGRYVSPIICEVDDELIRGGRRLTIMPGPKHARPRLDTVLFADLDVPTATRCINDVGITQPNVRGRIHFRLPGHSRPDSATRDFQAEMKRSHGFEFHVSEGTLRIETLGEGTSRDVDFQGGTARLHEVQIGSDDERLLRNLTGLRKLVLEIQAEDGTTLRFPLVMTQRR